MGRISSTHDRNQNVHKILIGKPEGNRTVARTKHELECVRLLVAHSEVQRR